MRATVLRLLSVVIAGALVALPTVALAATGTITRYPSSSPLQFALTPGPDGNVWFVGAGQVGRVTRTGAVTSWSPSGGTDRYIAVGPDGNLWFPQHQGRVARITPAGSITTFQVLAAAGNGPQFVGITTGPDGNLWMTDLTDNLIVRWSPSTAAVATFAAPQYCVSSSCSSWLFDITPGLDGNLWFTERRANKIGRITPLGVMTEFTGLTPYPAVCLPGAPGSGPLDDWPAGPVGITASADGNLWFTEVCNARVARITPTGVVTEFKLPHQNTGIACWQHSAPSCSHPFNIAPGFDGNVWVAEGDGWRVARVTPRGAITEYALPASSPVCCDATLPYVIGIALGWDGRMWIGTNAGWIGAVSVF